MRRRYAQSQDETIWKAPLVAIVTALALAACSPMQARQPGNSFADGQSTPTPTPTPTPSPQPKACPAGKSFPATHQYATLECLPQLDAIDYWSSQADFAALDAQSVSVAVLDGAFNTDHPDLKNAVAETYNFAKPGCSGQTQSPADCFNVKPAISGTPSAQQLGSINHGTIIAGVIAGRGIPGKGVLGVNPSAKLVLLARDASNYGLRALKHAVEKKYDVISMSWPLGPKPGTDNVPEFESLLKQAAAQGTVIVMAAGNTGNNVETMEIYPTRYSSIPGVIAVGATSAGAITNYSNYGPIYVDLGAPGTVASSGGDYSTTLYSVQMGTSFSGPMVAGAVSRIIQWMRAHGKAYTAADIEDILVNGSRANVNLDGKFRGGKELHMPTLLDALNAQK